jgi:peptide/nickel transport system substrate-binding protein
MFFDGLGENGKLPEGEKELSSVKIIDDKSLEITLVKSIDLNMIKEQLGTQLRILPEHVLKDVAPEDFAKDPFFLNPDVTSGPYKFVTYEKDQYVEYVANPDYYRGAPKIDHIFVKLMPAINLATQLETGEIHYNTGVGIGLIPSTDFDTVKGLENIRTKIEPNTSVQMMLYNVATLDDPKVRQAIAYCIDRNTILNKLLKGSGEVIDPPYTSLNPYLNTEIPSYDFDPEKGKAMLAEAGWDFDREINLVVPIGNKDREQSANIITQNLTDAGLKINMTKYDFPTIMQKGKKHDFDLLLIGNNFTLDPDGISTMLEGSGALNFSGYYNDHFDSLFVNGRAEPNPEKRQDYYDEIQEIIHKDLPLITLYSYQELMGVSDKLIKGEPRFYGTFYDLHEWELAD